jgi:hypothetical protein
MTALATGLALVPIVLGARARGTRSNIHLRW